MQHTQHTHTHTSFVSQYSHIRRTLCSTSYNNKQQDICCPKRQNAAEASPGCSLLLLAPYTALHAVACYNAVQLNTTLPSCACSFLTFKHTMQTLFLLNPKKSCHQSQVAFNLAISFSSHPKPKFRETEKCKILNSCIQNRSQL